MGYNAIAIACSQEKIARALARYSVFCLGFKKALLSPVADPYRIQEALEAAEQTNFMLIDAYMDGKPRGFDFAKNLGKRSLLLFYPGQAPKEDIGKFWVVLPNGLCQLREKVRELIKRSTTAYQEYLEMEKELPSLAVRPSHHGNANVRE